jgi:hypothetical protein
MTPDTQHAQYAEYAATWQTCRDCVTGQRAIHKGGERYLPKLSGQEPAEYEAYKKRALFFNATGRTKDGLVGLVFRKYPTIQLPAALEAYEEDINMEGLSLVGFAQSVVEEVLEVGRAGVLVEYPAMPSNEAGAAITIEQGRTLGLRPYLTQYKAEAILNWRYARVANATRLVQVFLQEAVEGSDEAQIRELHLDDGRYGQRVWRKGKNNQAGWVVVEESWPVMQGKPIALIPFWFCQPKEARGDVQAPPMEDLCYVNVSHYMSSADLENGAHISGLPTPWVNGVTNTGEFPVLHLGSSSLLTLPPDSTAGFLQCGTEGFATLEKLMDRKEAQMAALGARMLAPEKRQAETNEALETKRGGENSVLSTLAASVEMSLIQALQFMAEWVGAKPQEASIELNKAYVANKMDAPMLTAWLNMLQAGKISYATFYGALQRGELVPETQSAEDEKENIAQDGPALGGLGDDE